MSKTKPVLSFFVQVLSRDLSQIKVKKTKKSWRLLEFRFSDNKMGSSPNLFETQTGLVKINRPYVKWD